MTEYKSSKDNYGKGGDVNDSLAYSRPHMARYMAMAEMIFGEGGYANAYGPPTSTRLGGEPTATYGIDPMELGFIAGLYAAKVLGEEHGKQKGEYGKPGEYGSSKTCTCASCPTHGDIKDTKGRKGNVLYGRFGSIDDKFKNNYGDKRKAA